MKSLLKLVMFPLAFISILPSTNAEIYKWKDKNGNLVISSTPPPFGVIAEKKSTTAIPAASGSAAASRSGTSVKEVRLKRPLSDIKAILYKAEWCPYCRKAREYLNSLGVNLVQYDVDEDIGKKEEGVRKAGGKTGIPVIDIEGTVIVGYGEQAIKAAIDEKSSSGGRY